MHLHSPHILRINCYGIIRMELQPRKMVSPDGYDDPGSGDCRVSQLKTRPRWICGT